MHDPMTVAWEIKSPLKRKTKFFPEGYRNTLITIWHVDPEKDGTDDSCGWFKRSRHGDPEVLARIIKAFEFDWDRTWTYDPNEDGGEEDEIKRGKVTYPCGYFNPNGMPRFSPIGIVLNLFFLAAGQHFSALGKIDWDKSRRFMRKHLFDIMLFAENPTDSIHDSLTLKFGNDTKREDRIREFASTIYGWILRAEQPWYHHPRWHFHHFKIQIHFIESLKRWGFSRCSNSDCLERSRT